MENPSFPLTGSDHLERHCPRLGGTVPFAFCRTGGDDRQPCFKVFDCWWEIFDVVSYFRENFSEEAAGRIRRSRPQPKLASLVDLISQARLRIRSEE